MTASLYDSPAWRGLFHDPDLSPLFTDTAELRAILLVFGTLALTQAKAGLIPEVSAKAIQRAGMEVQVDPAALAEITTATADPVQALIAAFRSEMKAPEHAKWVHFESDTRLTAATGLSLRLRQAFKIISARMGGAETPGFAAYHADPATRSGIAQGIGLSDDADADPVKDRQELAAWVTAQAQAHKPQTPLDRTIQHQIPHLNNAIQTAPVDAASLINAMTLPQMVLGLGRLLR